MPVSDAGVVVIGAGVGGLVSAALLAAQGRTVTVVEAQPGPGGKLRTIAVDGDAIDATTTPASDTGILQLTRC